MSTANSRGAKRRSEKHEFKKKRIFRALSIALTALLAFPTAFLAGGNLIAAADGGIRAVLEIDKYTSEPATKIAYSGDQVVFTLEVGCQSQEIHCWDAVLTDTIPAPLVLDDVFYSSDGDFPDPIIEKVGNGFTATFQDQAPASPGMIGLQAGHGFVFTVITTLPANHTITTPEVLTNNATLTSTNPEVQDDSGSDTVEIRYKNLLKASINKEYSADELVAGGEGAAFTLVYANASNASVNTLTVSDPVAPSNPFEYLEFAGFTGASIFPEGADQVEVTLRLDGGTEVVFPTAATLPSNAGILAALTPATLADIVGFDLQFSSVAAGENILPGGDAGSVTVAVSQRADVANISSALSIPNVASAIVSKIGEPDSAPVTDNDTILVAPKSVNVTAGKRFVNSSGTDVTNIIAGEKASAILTATGVSNIPLDSLTISDPPISGTGATFTEQGVKFEGFGLNGNGLIPAAGIPTGVTGASLTLYLSDASSVVLSTPSGLTLDATGITVSLPGLAAGVAIDGFSLTVSGSDIPGNAVLNVPYQFTETLNTTRDITNTAQASATSDILSATSAQVSDLLTVIEPRVDSVVRKELFPNQVWDLAGSTFTAGLVGRLDGADGTSLSTIPVTEFTIEDSIDVPGNPSGASVWDTAYAPVTVRPVPVPNGVQANVQVLSSDGVTWISAGIYTSVVPEIDLNAVAGFTGPAKGVKVVYTAIAPATELPVFNERYRLVIEFEGTASGTAPGAYTNCAVSSPVGDSSLGDIVDLTLQPNADRCKDFTVVGAPIGTDPGTTPPGAVLVPLVSTDKNWTIDGANENAKTQQAPIWVPESGVRPVFGLTVGAENSSDFISINSLSLLEPALPVAAHPQTNPFEYIKINSFSAITLPENANISSLTVELFENVNGVSPVYTAAGHTTVSNLLTDVNAYLSGTDGAKVIQFKITLGSNSPYIQPWTGVKARLVVQVRETTASDGTPITSENYPELLTSGGINADNTISAYGLMDPSDEPVLVYANHTVKLRALSAQEVSVKAFKSISPSSATLFSADPDRRFQVVIRANRFAPTDSVPNLGSYSAPITMTLEDIKPEFWNMFELADITRIIGKPSGWTTDVRFKIEYRVGGTFSGIGSGATYDSTGSAWLEADGAPVDGWSVPAGNTPALPAGVNVAPAGYTFADVTGMRITFWSTNPDVALPDRSTSTTSLSGYGQQATLSFKLRSTYRSNNTIPADGTQIVNTVSASTANAQGNTATDNANATFQVSNATTGAVITKSPTGLVLPGGAEINYRLTFENTGTTVMQNLVVVDTIQCVAGKPNLVWDPVVAIGQLGVSVTPTTATGVTLDPNLLGFVYDSDCTTGTNRVTITFPAGDVLYPGQKVTVELPLIVRQGHEPTNNSPSTYPDGVFYNTYHFEYTDALGSYSVAPVRASVAVLTQQGYWYSKYVREVVEPGEKLSGRQGTCTGDEEEYLNSTSPWFERTPCIVVTKAGGTAEWRLWLSNVGNLPTQKMVAVDVLPTPGDVGITTALSTISRGTEFESILNNDFRIVWNTATEGTYRILYQTVNNDGCVLTGGVNEVDPFSAECADWESNFDSIRGIPSELAKVTALRFEFEWDPSVGLLQPGESVQIFYTTTTPIQLPSGVDPEDYPVSWNSIGGWAQTVSGGSYQYFRTAPLKAGIAYTLPDEAVTPPGLPDTGFGNDPTSAMSLSFGLIGFGAVLISAQSFSKSRKRRITFKKRG
ncbi:MAG: hypothetical protein KF916_04295 [Microbacteriaceae bacterium]|nr:hypothetical protein [Microbacteriaceae bacterium]